VPVDTIWIAASGGAMLLLAITLGLLRRRRRMRAPIPPEAEPPPPPPLVTGVTAGEREAAWSATRAADLLVATRDEASQLRAGLDRAEQAAVLFETESDDLRATVAESDRLIDSLRNGLEQAERQIATLETEIAAAARSPVPGGPMTGRIEELEGELERLRDAVASHAAVERDLRHRLAAAESTPAERDTSAGGDLVYAGRRIDELEAQLADTEILDSPELEERIRDLTARLQVAERERAELAAEHEKTRAEAARVKESARHAREEADRGIAAAAAEVARHSAKVADLERTAGDPNRDAARLVVRDAEIADLEARLAALSAARESELRRLNDKIGSMEHLYVEVETRERRIEQLEDEVKALAEARDEAVADLARTERELVAVQGAHAEALAAIERLAALERDLVEARTRIAELEQVDAAGTLRAEVDRLHKTLAGERERNARLQRRLSLESTESARSPSYAEWDHRLRQRVDQAVASAVGPLEARIERLRVVIVEKEQRLAQLAEPAQPAGPDDLTRIKGIGPKIRDILHDLEITTFREIAQFTDQDVERVGAALPVYGRRILDDGWIYQARELAD
jgi:predicted flap endonuclease-1-like 5' DNA nuclease/chromosome segregation ATPase